MFHDNNCREIQTGVDKLLFLVNKNKEISLAEASQILEIEKEVLDHWSDALENKGLLKVKYTFNKKILLCSEYEENGYSWTLKLDKLLKSIKRPKNKTISKHISRLKNFSEKVEESNINPELKKELREILKKVEALA